MLRQIIIVAGSHRIYTEIWIDDDDVTDGGDVVAIFDSPQGAADELQEIVNTLMEGRCE